MAETNDNFAPAKRVLLCILDGWGIAKAGPCNAVEAAKTPVYDALFAKCARTQLATSGLSVGLPEGQMGNSEVGHLTLGAGRVVYQELARINQAVADGTLENNAELQRLFSYCKVANKPLHLLGLLSDGGVHSHMEHLFAVLRYAHKAGLPKVCVHAFLDGRDTDPQGGAAYLEALQAVCAETGAEITSVIGRYFAMDRDQRWERSAEAYHLLIHATGMPTSNVVASVRQAYADGITDEFMPPLWCGEPEDALISGDGVLFFNFRTDRGRQLSQMLTQRPFPDVHTVPMALHFVTLTQYDATYKNVHLMLAQQNIDNTLGEVLDAAGRTQLRAAETEKYPHVTFFFNGQKEALGQHEQRLLVPSPKVATYDLQPEMSAPELAQDVVDAIAKNAPDVIILNFANPDMVGHTGVFSAVVKACETVDTCLGMVVTAAETAGYTLLITADHGNAEHVLNADGSPNTAHTTNPVWLLLANAGAHTLRNGGSLADVAPTVLALLGIEQPSEMTGRSLLA